jgi:benzoyl-CoA reductase/2-hydroxyglutaryl-CoA dehydratase subunit BcrC/BadD/HgdB
VDLNNLFISDPDPERLVALAERAGFPINCCTWIKGIYGVAMKQEIRDVLCVTTGDCSNTVMLMEVFRIRGLKVIPFAFPDFPNVARMQAALQSLAATLGTTVAAAEKVRKKLERCRSLAAELDALTWERGLVSGWENHYWLVSSSDFMGNPDEYERQLGQLVAEARGRNPYPDDMLRLAYIGVPSIFPRDLYQYLERQGARVVFNEVQRQFAMPDYKNSLAQQYTSYTYPYSIFDRLRDILPELRQRRIDGVVHYVQAFCHRGIADIVFRHEINLPILTLEGNADYLLTEHLRTRIEAYLDLVRRRNRAAASKQTASH